MGLTASPPVATQAPLGSIRSDRVRRPRNLVVVRAGDNSLHREWIADPARDFDLFISYYGEAADRHRDDADFHEARKGPKWPCIADVLADNAALLANYDAFWFPDDDLSADTATINRMFAFFCAFRLALAQPALSRDSYYTWDRLLQQPDCELRYVDFVEVMAPIFSRRALQLCVATFSESRSGWGLDWLWPRLCRAAGAGRIAVIDATPVRHTRPLGGDLYKNHPEMDPRLDEARVLASHGLAQVKALGKYAGWSRVREVPLSTLERLQLWLKRINGRRRHGRRSA